MGDLIVIKTVSTDDEIVGIRELQLKNLKTLISVEEAEQEGFVTCDYSIDFLRKMNSFHPSIIAKDGDSVVGYALVLVRELMTADPLLEELERTLTRITYKGESVSNRKYVIVGQLCVAKGYRGLGLVPRMYNHYRETLQDIFDCCITDVATHNPRSVKAHQKSGFEIVHTEPYDNVTWYIVLWDWKKQSI